MIIEMILLQIDEPVTTSPNIVQVLGLVLGFFTSCFTLVMTYLIARLNFNQREAATRVEAVKEELKINNIEIKEKVTKIEEIGKITHSLVNGRMGIQLKLNMLLAQQLADKTQEPMHLESAKIAKIAYDDFQKEEDKSHKLQDENIQISKDNLEAQHIEQQNLIDRK
jgi:hypothetical protein